MSHDAPRRSVADALGRIGEVLTLQLLFVACALTVVGVLPGAVAFQRVLTDTMRGEARFGWGSAFMREVVRALRLLWPLAIAVPVLFVGFVVSLWFWSATGGVIGVAALIVLLPLFGGFLALYVSTLAGAPDAPRSRSRHLLRQAIQRVRAQPLRSAGAVVALLSWYLLLARVPTLALVGTGVVPAFLAHWLRRSSPEVVRGCQENGVAPDRA